MQWDFSFNMMTDASLCAQAAVWDCHAQRRRKVNDVHLPVVNNVKAGIYTLVKHKKHTHTTAHECVHPHMQKVP